MPLTHKDWDEILGRIKALIAQKGESFEQGIVVKRDLQRKLIWVTGFGQQPIPMYQFHSDVYVYDEWKEPDIISQVITASATYTTPANTKFLIVECIGPGGGGGGSNNSVPGGGGGAGAYCWKKISNPAATYAVVVGTGGAGGNSSGGNGSDGSGPTTFSTLSASAGNHGWGGGSSIPGGGAAPSESTGGDFNGGGGPGQTAGSGASWGGGGGSSHVAGGAAGATNGVTGYNSNGYGAGGGGGGLGGRAGGHGGDGVCIVHAHTVKTVVRKKLVSATPQVPEIGDLVLIAHHLGSRELPKCLGILNSVGFANFDAGLE